MPQRSEHDLVGSLIDDPAFGPLRGLLLLLIERIGRDRGSLLRAGTAAELVFVAIALVIAALSGDPGVSHGTNGLSGPSFGAAVADAVAALLAIAMGVQNAVARRLAVPDLTTTVLTMTLTGLLAVVAIGAALATRRPAPWRIPPPKLAW